VQKDVQKSLLANRSRYSDLWWTPMPNPNPSPTL